MFTTLGAAFAALTFLGWIAIAVLFILEWVFVANEKWGFSTVFFLFFCFSIWYFTPSIIQVFVDNPWNIFWYLICYIGIGVVWSILRWGLFVADKRDEEKLYSDSERERVEPHAEDHIDDIVGWMAFWPWSILWSIFDDIFRRIYRTIAHSLESVFNWVSKSVYNAGRTKQNRKSSNSK
jgi:hypothetical protein